MCARTARSHLSFSLSSHVRLSVPTTTTQRLKEYQSCETLCSELAVRVESFWSDGSRSGDATDIRLRLRQCDQQLSQLRTALFSDDPDRFITSDERERRERCLEALYDRARHLRTQFSSSKPAQSAAPDVNRDLLFGPTDNTASRGQADYNQLDPEIVRQRQMQALEEQDRGLEALSKIISRQKNIAQTIDSEVTTQTEIVSTLADTIGRVGVRTEGATRRTAALITRDNTCGYWIIAILLFIAIIIVAVIP